MTLKGFAVLIITVGAMVVAPLYYLATLIPEL